MVIANTEVKINAGMSSINKTLVQQTCIQDIDIIAATHKPECSTPKP